MTILAGVGTNLEQAAQLISTAFATNKDGALDYTAEFLESCYRYPGADRELSPAFFEGDRIVALLASLPRCVRLQRRSRRVAILTFNSVHPDFRGHGLGAKMFSEGVYRAQKNGFDGVLFFCVEGNMAAIRSGVGGVEAAGVACHHVFTLDYMMALPRPAQVEVQSAAVDIDAFLEASETLASRLPFARVWSREEAQWELFHRTGAVHFAMKAGGNAGIVTGYLLKDNRGTTSVQIENVLIDRLDPEHRYLALAGFLGSVAGKAQIAMAPMWRYVDEAVFRKAGFRKSPRRLNVYLSLWGGPAPERFESMYIDVL